MRYLSDNAKTNQEVVLAVRLTRGITLVEVVIYAALLSVLLAGFISYAYRTHLDNIRLTNEIENAYN
ncbi:prepilin-type N-terminal cleavage/methylation domain-containing protein [Patescibacteria group bacterium]|nr:prepilin-type N-terminal cleavage/methylation domain-containing protein [Patescibacteria group bacterium]MDE1946349.1 prepilin-type N-terminal cleavage/methylation domain-containing protein [Patescibacteria group bacterium]MDE2010801.1 prepilin-type N-terminal cleavage/methylation domain-containing protein [Patescibacteria group bacterium]MDE2233266.1 prepilin-type N-terminal cleavage/methylation domain-containing protein [Patescibacteria group bacterium]